MVRKRKQEFLQNAHRAFDADFGEKAGEGKAARLKRKNDQLLIHRALTLARDFPPGGFLPNWRSNLKPVRL